jgi:hypothetical protein
MDASGWHPPLSERRHGVWYRRGDHTSSVRVHRRQPRLVLSSSAELRLRLRWVAILYGHVHADLAVTGGVHTAEDC